MCVGDLGFGALQMKETDEKGNETEGWANDIEGQLQPHTQLRHYLSADTTHRARRRGFVMSTQPRWARYQTAPPEMLSIQTTEMTGSLADFVFSWRDTMFQNIVFYLRLSGQVEVRVGDGGDQPVLGDRKKGNFVCYKPQVPAKKPRKPRKETRQSAITLAKRRKGKKVTLDR